VNRYEKAIQLSDKDFKQVIGVKKPTYEEMLAELRTAYAEKHRRRGRHSKLSLEDILFMALTYWRQYVTQKELAFEFEIGEATVHDWIVWVEDTLVKCKKFRLPGKKALLDDTEIEIVLVDVTESPVERPQKNKESGIPAKRSVTPKKHS
jgi:transposase